MDQGRGRSVAPTWPILRPQTRYKGRGYQSNPGPLESSVADELVIGLLRAATWAHEVARSWRSTRIVARRLRRWSTVRIAERHARQRHAKRHHERRDQQRDALPHLLTPSPLLRKPSKTNDRPPPLVG